MKKLPILLLSLFSMNAFSAVNDYVVTSTKYIGQIHVNAGMYYFKATDNNWGATSCPNAQYGYISESDPGAKAILSVALSGKGMQLPIVLSGLCGSASGNDTYIRVDRIILA